MAQHGVLYVTHDRRYGTREAHDSQEDAMKEHRRAPEDIDVVEYHPGAVIAGELSVEVTINGVEKKVHSLLASYEDVVVMAGKTGNPSVTYHRGFLPKPDGCLAPGETVYLKDGMYFAVQHTGNA